MMITQLLKRVLIGTATIFLALAILTSCGRYSRIDRSIKINAISLFGGNTLTLDTVGRNCSPGVWKTNGYVTFHSDKSMDDLFATLQLPDGVTAQRIHNAVFLAKNNGETREYYCISTAKAGYVFGGMRGDVVVDVTEQGKQYQTILLPIHLIRDELILNGEMPYYTLYANVDYKAYGDVVDFQNFYRDCGWYTTECESNYIFVTGWKQEAEAMKNALNAMSLEQDVPFTVRLTQKEDGLYFAILTS